MAGDRDVSAGVLPGCDFGFTPYSPRKGRPNEIVWWSTEDLTEAAMPIRTRAATATAGSFRFLFAGLSFAAAISLGPAQAHAQRPQARPEARVIVNGEGSVTVQPDYARITTGVTTRARTVKEATDANTKLMGAVTAALRDLGIEQRDIQTSHFSVQPVYAPAQPNTEPKLSGFSVSNQLSVTIHQIAAVGPILDRLIAAGANDLGGVEFLHSDLSKALDRAREAAVADARRKAELYARAAGLELGRVAWITEDPGLAPPGGMKALRAAGGFAAPVPIASGEDTLRVQITVGFATGL